jgi:hypothetical protein
MSGIEEKIPATITLSPTTRTEEKLTKNARWIRNDRGAEGSLVDWSAIPTTVMERVVATTAIVVADRLTAISKRTVRPAHRKDAKVGTVMDDLSRLQIISVVRSMEESYAMLTLMPARAVPRKGKY